VDESAIPIITSYYPAAVTVDYTWPRGETWDASVKIDPWSAKTSKLTLTFNHAVAASDQGGKVYIDELSWGSDPYWYNWCNFSVSDPYEVVVSFNEVVITPYADCRLLRGGQYRLYIDSGAFETASTGLAFGGIDAESAYYFNTVEDLTPPTISTTTPADGAVGVDEGAPYILYYDNEFVSPKDGNITFHGYWKGELVDTISINMNDWWQVDVWTDDTTVIEIWPDVYWWSQVEYKVSLEAGALQDASFNDNLEMTQGLSFTTANTFPPELDSISAVIDSANVPTITIVFRSLGPVVAGIGGLNVVNTETKVSVLYCGVADTSKVSFTPNTEVESHSGNLYEVVLSFSDPLPGPATYEVHWAPAAFKDTYGNGVLAEASGKWAFQVSGAVSSCVAGSTWSYSGLSPCSPCSTCGTAVEMACTVQYDTTCALSTALSPPAPPGSDYVTLYTKKSSAKINEDPTVICPKKETIAETLRAAQSPPPDKVTSIACGVASSVARRRRALSSSSTALDIEYGWTSAAAAAQADISVADVASAAGVSSDKVETLAVETTGSTTALMLPPSPPPSTSPSPSPPPSEKGEDSSGLAIGVIIGIVVGASLVALCVLILFYYFMCRKNSSKVKIEQSA